MYETTREIKFRAWDVRRRRMVYLERLSIEEYESQYEQCVALIFGKSVHSDFAKLASREDYVITQYTGLKDKNGKEIYEGDIVHVEAVAYGRNMNAIVFWKDGGFWLKWKDGYESYIQDWTKELAESEVVGNIYENPELLQG